MIKNIIFDIGGVLTRFDPNDYLSPFGFDKEKSKALNFAIFKSPVWKDYMVGKIDKNKFKEFVVYNNKKLKKEIEFILDEKNAPKLLPPLTEGIEFLKTMKREGYKIYILSNIVGASLEYFKNTFTDVIDIIDGGVYSCEVGLQKPDEKIFELVLKNYHLVPSETLFLDDSLKNVEKACSLNIVGHLCQPLKRDGVFEEIIKTHNLIDGKSL